MRYEITDELWAKNMEQGVMQYTDALYNAVYDDEDQSPDTLSGILFCGCDTCFWREALTYLVPVIIDGYKSGKLVEE
jgi:hypothetical protein